MSQMNGVTERKNLVEMPRCMMLQSKLSISFWAEAAATANFIRNRCISKALGDKIIFELWHGRRPNAKHMHTFGETAYMLDKASSKGKLDSRGIRCTFLGYDEPTRSYRVWIPRKQKVTVTRDIRFTNNDVNMENPKEPTLSTPNQDRDSNRKMEDF